MGCDDPPPPPPPPPIIVLELPINQVVRGVDRAVTNPYSQFVEHLYQRDFKAGFRQISVDANGQRHWLVVDAKVFDLVN